MQRWLMQRRARGRAHLVVVLVAGLMALLFGASSCSVGGESGPATGQTGGTTRRGTLPVGVTLESVQRPDGSLWVGLPCRPLLAAEIAVAGAGDPRTLWRIERPNPPADLDAPGVQGPRAEWLQLGASPSGFVTADHLDLTDFDAAFDQGHVYVGVWMPGAIGYATLDRPALEVSVQPAMSPSTNGTGPTTDC